MERDHESDENTGRSTMSPPGARALRFALPCEPENALMPSDGGECPPSHGGEDMGRPSPQIQRRERSAAAELGAQLAALDKLTVAELVEKYREVYGVPTRTRNKDYLRKRVAWRIQELAEGGLSEKALARIEQLAPEAPVRWRATTATSGVAPAIDATAPQRDPRLPPVGSILHRTHGGVDHQVTVLDDGFEYLGERYATVSRVARAIAGTPWNGFLFFGLKRRTEKKATAETPA